jgi:hypothetical protein
MKVEQAETIAIQALGWLAGDENLCGTFLGTTGATVGDLRSGASDPAFLASVLEFLTMNDDWVIAFCDAAGIGYDQPLRARYALPGADSVNWT